TAYAKKITIFKDAAAMRVLSNPVAWRIVELLSKEPLYPAQVSKRLGIYEQSAYYYIRKLVSIGALEETGRVLVRGGTAKVYHPASPAFGIEMESGEEQFDLPLSGRLKNAQLFFKGYLNEKNLFKGLIIVGAPEPHGPYKSSARDGHYAVQLAFFLGSISAAPPSDFVVKLDSDAKAEKVLAGNNLISIGGPGTNLVTAEFNSLLPIRFDEKNFWAGLVDKAGRRYTSDNHGLVAKIRNPNDKDTSIIVVAGVRSAGTKAAVIALTGYSEDVLSKYYNDSEEFAAVVQGFDMDSDGKIDHVDVVARA
ncbi:MAG TPA: helix-turn-helix domain-containing protein, partial [Nitrososphaera sp.]|nr:helix-turn-helix domain-containing protein [Nitrososphaera sp.]